MLKKGYLLFVLLLAIVLGACGGGTEEEPEIAATEATTVEEPAATEETATDGKVQIRWFVGLGTGTNDEQIAAQEEVVADFNASQDGIELVLEIVPFEAARDTLATQIASGAGPDIVGPVGWGGSNAFYGQWLDMSPQIEATGFDTSIFNPALVEFYQTEEGQVGLPFAVFPGVVVLYVGCLWLCSVSFSRPGLFLYFAHFHHFLAGRCDHYPHLYLFPAHWLGG